MKNIFVLKLVTLFAVLLFLSCGSKEKVITPNGIVYELKGSKFYSNGEEITEELSREKKSEINEILNNRIEFEKKAEKLKKELEDAQNKAAKALKKAEKEQKALAKKVRRKDDARKDFFKVRDKLKKQNEKYQRLIGKGKLSPDDINGWEKTIKKLEKKVQDAEQKLKRY
ncbi:hypothetical protein ES676_12350 [Bizionia saleffrena]|uniref:Lipoprotein n=1 Tax=Bizionia saleffrena TaxID=291189 RepID=A0A8H2LB22_9FLAO|nr:hypothetical protein [Bizionia saleffrena]TYB71796.1 hypothetical protein ES676_12350 [Bizionia saleffrena]